MTHPNIAAALFALTDLDFPRAQLNDRSALTLLALADVGPTHTFSDTMTPLIGVTPIMDWIRDAYDVKYAPNTRETIRRQTLHQFRDAGLVLYNPDDPGRAVNSPRAVYQLTDTAAALLRMYGTRAWAPALKAYMDSIGSLAKRYARARNMKEVPVVLNDGSQLRLSPGDHSQLIRDVIEQFAPRFCPGSVLVYAGDTGQKLGHFDFGLLSSLGVLVDSHGKMPDVVLYHKAREWLILVEAVTSHGPVDGKRHDELAALFAQATPGLVYVTAFSTRGTMTRYLQDIAWETEVWVADSPSHLIHFNGDRFLGPHS